MSPLVFLFGTLGIAVFAAAASAVARAAERRTLKKLALGWKMHYSPADRFRLAARVAERFPIPGAANVRISDVIYGVEADGYRYYLTAQYTIGVIHAKKRRRSVCTVREAKSSHGGDLGQVVVNQEECTLAAGYRKLFERIAGGGAAADVSKLT